MAKQQLQFSDFFPNSKFRYLDLSGGGKPPISSDVERKDLNKEKYDSFFTCNGFAGDNATRENCINLNAFYIDIDKQLTEEEIEKIKSILMPTFIIKTFHGFHWYWCLDEVIYKSEMSDDEWNKTMALWEKIEQAIVDKIPDSDKSV